MTITHIGKNDECNENMIPKKLSLNVSSSLLVGLITQWISKLILANPGYRRIADGAFWTILSSGISQSVGFAVAVICARLLGAHQYGELGIILSTANLFTSFAGFGLGVTAVKHIAEFRQQKPVLAGRIIGMSAIVSLISGLLVGIVLIGTAAWLAEKTLNAPHLTSTLQLSAIMLLFEALNGSQIGALNGFEAFKTQAIVNALRGFVSFPVIILGVSVWGFKGAVIAYSTVSALKYIICQIALGRECRRNGISISYRFERSDLALLYKFSLPVLIAGLSYTPAVWCSNAFLANRSGYSELGIFNAAFQWQAAIMFFSNAIANVGLPMLSSVLPEKDIKKYKKFLGLNFILTVGLSVLSALPIAIGSRWIMSFYGNSFKNGALTLFYICLATVISAANISVGHAIWSLNAARSGMMLGLLRGSALVIAAYALAPIGAVGLALAYVSMGVVQTLIQVPFMFWLLKRQEIAWTK